MANFYNLRSLVGYLIILCFSLLLYSCEPSPKGADGVSSDKDLLSENIREDSLRNVEIEKYKQDSIDAKNIKGYSVKRIEGKEKYGGVTKVEYQSSFQLIDEARETAKKEMWPQDKLDERIDLIKSAWSGGLITLYIERKTVGAANTEYFTIIVKDLKENELYRQELEGNIPEPPASNGDWWNYGSAYLEKRITPPFYVYVVDELGDKPFKFKVSPISN